MSINYWRSSPGKTKSDNTYRTCATCLFNAATASYLRE
jgi:hypothetical protein